MSDEFNLSSGGGPPIAFLQIFQALVQATNAQAQTIKNWLAGLTASGDLSGTYPGPMTVAKINGTGLGSTIATAGNLLIGNGTSWVTEPVSGDASITSLGALTVSRIAGQAVAQASWTPTDGSGVGLVFSGVSANVTRLGNLVFAYASVTYPVTASGATALISGLPFAAANQDYANGAAAVDTSGTIGIVAVKNTTTAKMLNLASGATILNSDLSGRTIAFMLIYPAS